MAANLVSLNLTKRALDAFIVCVTAYGASLFYFGVSIFDLKTIYTESMYICAAMVFYFFSKFKLYASWRGRSMYLMFGQIVMAWSLVLLLCLLFSYSVHQAGNLSRLWMILWFIFGSAALLTYRFVVYSLLHWMRRRGMNIKRVIVVGYGRSAQELHKRARYEDRYGYVIKAVHCDSEELKYLKDVQINWIQDLTEIPSYVARFQIDEVWIALQISEYSKLEELQFLLRNTLTDIRWIPDTPGISMISRKTIDFLGMLTVDLNCPETAGLKGVLKELFDKVFSFFVLVGLALPFIIIGICIKCSSPGPVFFKQARHGLNGKKFYIYKFRSMYFNTEQNAVTQAKKNDARVTPLGRLLRRTSIDELPQFLNVLIGHMSVVGPRPHAVEHNEFYKNRLEVYMLRHRVKPGITGWAQIHGLRGETDSIEKMSERVQLDIEYIRHWSILLDIKIILWTAFNGWTGKNVY